MIPQVLWYQVKGTVQRPEEPPTGPPEGKNEPPRPSDETKHEGPAKGAGAMDDDSLSEGGQWPKWLETRDGILTNYIQDT